jgi:putative methanogenesis marker protein 12
MFIGVDHGTAGIRFAGLNEGNVSVFELSREKAVGMDCEELIRELENGLEIEAKEIELVALTYSMGDGFTTIRDIKKVRNRGVRSERGAGVRVGGGTNVFDVIRSAGIPAIMIPGLHAGSEKIDRRIKFFSHCASPEKVGIAYYIYKKGFEHFIFSDISSNTVTMAVASGILIGGIDACLGSPGLYHGPIDLQMLREIEAGRLSANEAFSTAGVLRKKWLKAEVRDDNLVMDTLALFAAMELSAMRLLMTDYGVPTPEIFLTGSEGEKEELKKRIDRLLRIKTETITRYSPAIGCAEIAKDVFYGEKSILGIDVE